MSARASTCSTYSPLYQQQDRCRNKDGVTLFSRLLRDGEDTTSQWNQTGKRRLSSREYGDSSDSSRGHRRVAEGTVLLGLLSRHSTFEKVTFQLGQDDKGSHVNPALRPLEPGKWDQDCVALFRFLLNSEQQQEGTHLVSVHSEWWSLHLDKSTNSITAPRGPLCPFPAITLPQSHLGLEASLCRASMSNLQPVI